MIICGTVKSSLGGMAVASVAMINGDKFSYILPIF